MGLVVARSVEIRVAAGHGHGHWAMFVQRHERQREDQLVLDEGAQVEAAAQHQQVFFAALVERFGRGLVGDEAKCALHDQRHIDGREAALALQGYRGVHAQLQPDLRHAAQRLAHAALGPPIHKQIGAWPLCIERKPLIFQE